MPAPSPSRQLSEDLAGENSAQSQDTHSSSRRYSCAVFKCQGTNPGNLDFEERSQTHPHGSREKQPPRSLNGSCSSCSAVFCPSSGVCS